MNPRPVRAIAASVSLQRTRSRVESWSRRSTSSVTPFTLLLVPAARPGAGPRVVPMGRRVRRAATSGVAALLLVVPTAACGSRVRRGHRGRSITKHTAAVLARTDAIHRPADLVVAGTSRRDPDDRHAAAGHRARQPDRPRRDQCGHRRRQYDQRRRRRARPARAVGDGQRGNVGQRGPRRNPETPGQQRRRDHRPGLVARRPRGARRADGRRRPGLFPHGHGARPQRLSQSRAVLPHRAERLVDGPGDGDRGAQYRRRLLCRRVPRRPVRPAVRP